MYVHAIITTVALAAAPFASEASAEALACAVRVASVAPAAAPYLRRALENAQRIYRTIGVEIVWLNQDDGTSSAPPLLRQVQLVLLARARGAATALPEQLGVALQTDDRPIAAYVFFDRIERIASEHAVAVEDVLATVIAHEIAHLILRSGAHSAAGLMGARWDRRELIEASQGQLRFSADVQALMRRQLDIVVMISDRSTTTPESGREPPEVAPVRRRK